MSTTIATQTITVTRRNRSFGFDFSTGRAPLATPANEGLGAADVAAQLADARKTASGCDYQTVLSYKGQRVISVNGDDCNPAKLVAQLVQKEWKGGEGEPEYLGYICNSLELELEVVN